MCWIPTGTALSLCTRAGSTHKTHAAPNTSGAPKRACVQISDRGDQREPHAKRYTHHEVVAARAGRFFRFLIQQVQFFAGFEAHSLAGGNADLGSGTRVAANAGLARLDGEDAKATELNAVACDEGLLHAFEDGVNGSLRLGSRKPGPLDDSLDEILFDQEGTFPIEAR